MERSHPKPIELTTDQQLGRLVDSGEPVELYMRQAATTELLSKDEEVILFKKIEAGNEASKKLAENDFSDRHRQNFIEKVNEGHSAKNHVVQANTRLVISIAKKYQHRGLPLLDLIQAGNEGLMRSIGKFEYKRGNRFSTYATWWIRQAVSRAVADEGRTIRLPVHLYDEVKRMYRKIESLKQEINRYPTINEIAKSLDTSPERVDNMLRWSRTPAALEKPVSEKKYADTLADFIEDGDSLSPSEIAEENSLKEDTRNLLEVLPPREATIIKMRFGMGNYKTHTLEEVGQKFGLTRERIRQIEKQVIKKLGKNTEAKEHLRR